MSDNMGSEERDQINKNNEVKVSGIEEDLKVGKLNQHKYEVNAETESGKKIWWVYAMKRTLLKEMRSIKMIM